MTSGPATNANQDRRAANAHGPVLSVRGLQTHFKVGGGVLRAVDNVSFDIQEGEVLGLVGESGCGKSMTALSIMGLVPSPPGQIVGGSIMFDNRDLLTLDDDEMRHVRGREIAMVFQEPMTSLNPVMSVGRQLAEPLEEHQGLSKKAARARAEELLSEVGIPDPRRQLGAYPHEMSGGQRQRVMIAIAMSCGPRLLIADEATTALDVTIQAQILELLRGLADQYDAALLLISHNLGVVARYANRVNVMYAGQIREMATARDLYSSPSYPYTVGLLRSVPRLDRGKTDELIPIEGEVPDLANLPEGCAFSPRCPWSVDKCKESSPPLVEVKPGHHAACWESDRVSADVAGEQQR